MFLLLTQLSELNMYQYTGHEVWPTKAEFEEIETQKRLRIQIELDGRTQIENSPTKDGVTVKFFRSLTKQQLEILDNLASDVSNNPLSDRQTRLLREQEIYEAERLKEIRNLPDIELTNEELKKLASFYERQVSDLQEKLESEKRKGY